MSNTDWLHFHPGGEGGGLLNIIFTPLSFYISFLTKKVPFPYTFHWKNGAPFTNLLSVRLLFINKLNINDTVISLGVFSAYLINAAFKVYETVGKLVIKNT